MFLYMDTFCVFNYLMTSNQQGQVHHKQNTEVCNWTLTDLK